MPDISKQTKASVKSTRDALTKELDELADFINTDDYNDLPQADRDLLVEQHRSMTAYQDALGARLARFQDLEDRKERKAASDK